MQNDARCFIRIAKGIFEEITYTELEKRRKLKEEYRKKKFVPVQGRLLEVTDDEYKEFYKEIERNKYVKRESKKFNFISIEDVARNDLNNKNSRTDILVDKDMELDIEIARRIEVERLKDALLKLEPTEYELIRSIFFEDKTIREYAEDIGKPFMTIQNRKISVLKKLKKILKFF